MYQTFPTGKIQEDTIINVQRSWHKVPVAHHLIKLEFFSTNFQDTKFHENLPTGSRVIPCEQMADWS
jgi:hypothetical protein